MDYKQLELEKALKELSDKYPDQQVNNNKNFGFLNITNEEFIRLSMKRSHFKNIMYDKCHFEKAAFNGSIFQYVHFIDNIIEENTFSNSNFYNSEIYGENSSPYIGNNFSQSNFTKCSFHFGKFISSSFLQTLFHQCEFDKTSFQSSTMEGSKFINCTLSYVDMGNVNIEFIELRNTLLQQVIFPFYQFPYIIGAADCIKDSTSTVILRAGQKQVPMELYKKQINNLILYFYDKADYFPMCNLQIANNNNDLATQTLLDGIHISLHNLDFRMIKHFCGLAKHHEMLDEFIIKKISNSIESFLVKEDIPPEQLNNCMIHLGEIRKLLLSGNNDSVTLNLNIRTNIEKENKDGIKYVNELCSQLNIALSTNDFGQTGFQVAILNHSPYEIVLEVLSNTAAITSIISFIWQIIDKFKADKIMKDSEYLKDYVATDIGVYKDYLGTRIELCKEQLLKLKNTYSQKKMNNYIEEIVQQLKTDVEELYDKNIMIFIKKNN